MVDVTPRHVDAKTIADEIINRIAAAHLAGMALLKDPVIGSILRLETELVVGAVLDLLDAADVQPPAECRHAARLAAKHGVPLPSLTKAYRIGHGVLLDATTAQHSSVPRSAVSAAPDRVRKLFAVMDSLIDLVTAEYQLEIELLTEQSNDGARLRSVQHVLQDTAADASLPFYALHRTHTAVVATGQIRDRVTTLANARPGARLAVDADHDLSWAWFCDLNQNEIVDALRRSGALGTAGVGGPAAGADGFRQAHHQAALAREVAVASEQSVASYWDSGVTAIGLGSRGESRALVIQQLGDLAADTARNRELRRTLEAYADSGHSIRSAAATLAVSERTVSNRLSAARRVLPPSTDLLSLELALALRFSSTLGSTLQVR